MKLPPEQATVAAGRPYGSEAGWLVLAPAPAWAAPWLRDGRLVEVRAPPAGRLPDRGRE